jgi:hypothetical protein
MEVNFLQKLIVVIIVWIVVPAILFGLFILSSSIVKKAKSGEHKLSTQAGFWAGMITFVIFLIYELPLIRFPYFNSVSLIDMSLWMLLLSTVGGYFFLHILKLTIPTRIAGFVVLLLVFCSLSALFNYFFIQSINDILMSMSLGLALGVLIHIILEPKTINIIFDKEKIESGEVNRSVNERE